MQDFIEIDLKELFFALLHKFWLIALCAVLVGGLSYLYTDNFITPMYRASVSIYVNNASPAKDGSTYISGSDLATAQRLVNTYVNIIKSNTVLEKVVEKSGLEISKESVRGMMTANPVENTEIFEIHISNADPERAARVANAVAEVAPEEISNFLEGSSTKIIDYAEVPQYRYTPSYRRNVFLGLVIGGALAAVYIVLRTILDVRIKSEEDLERLFEIPVLGTIPEFDAEHKGIRYGYSRYGYGHGGHAGKGSGKQ
ncbi:MAG: Wzz/FepE/Etk N-terminal domain-containing protein [Eubacteriales bacterium]|nr:Wzz/FepE/Etk N-terminal domain-containing protein [Eubacteriales bacterium]